MNLNIAFVRVYLYLNHFCSRRGGGVRVRSNEMRNLENSYTLQNWGLKIDAMGIVT